MSLEDFEGSNSPMLQKRNDFVGAEANYSVEEARQESLRGHGTQGERFWRRQQGKAETIEVGRRLIAKVTVSRSLFSYEMLIENRLLQRSPRNRDQAQLSDVPALTLVVRRRSCKAFNDIESR